MFKLYFNRVISDIFVVLSETTLTISDSTGTGSPLETEKSTSGVPNTTEITEITRFKKIKRIFRVPIPEVCDEEYAYK